MLNFVVFDLFVAVEGQVVALGDDAGFGDEEGLGGAGAVGLGVEVVPAGEDVGEVVGVDGVAFVVEEKPSADVVEPDVVGAARLVFVKNRMAVETPA